MKLSKLLAVLGCTFSLMAVSATAEQVNLKAPQHSDDGSFVLRVESELSTHETSMQGMQLEIHRNLNGGEYQRILTGPHFSALSELVRENGVYGYKARWVTAESINSDFMDVSREFSEPVFIKVTTKVPRMIKPRSDRIASNATPGTLGIY